MKEIYFLDPGSAGVWQRCYYYHHFSGIMAYLVLLIGNSNSIVQNLLPCFYTGSGLLLYKKKYRL